MMNESDNHFRAKKSDAEVILKGDKVAFQEVIESHRWELQLHCYRMSGSFHEAEDLVQETLLNAWRGFDRFQGRASLRGWLYKIATNTCLNALAGRARRILPDTEELLNLQTPLGSPATEVSWLEPYPDSALETIADITPGPEACYEMREGVELAFVAAIQYLTPRQRAVLLLCDVIGLSAAEVAGLLNTSTASVNSALQRARATLAKRFSGGQTRVPEAMDEQQRSLVDRYIMAWNHFDLDGFAALLREDAVLNMPPWRQWFRGREAIRAFFAGVWSSTNYGAFHLVETAANRQSACAVYSRPPEKLEFRAHSIHVLTFHHNAISALTSFIDPHLFAAFDLPTALPTHDITSSLLQE